MAANEPNPQPDQSTVKSTALSSDDAARLTAAIANMTSLGLPLASGLHALAKETPGSSLAVALNQLADKIASGVPFDRAIEALQQQFPPHLRGLIAVGLRTDTLGETLADFAARERAMRARRMRMRQALAYPVILFLCSLPILLFMVFVLLPQMREVYDDFGLVLPEITVLVFQVLDDGAKVVGIVLIALILALIFGRWLLQFRWIDRLYSGIPLLGPVHIWGRVANFSQVLGTLVKHHVPLPEALKFTAAALPGLDVKLEARRLSNSITSGKSLSLALHEKELFPPLLTAFVHCGERAGRLSDALEAAGTFAALQTDRYSERIRLILPLIIFTAVFFLASSLFVAMLMPMIKLISSLTG